jgi:ABC-type sugar transport system ATPase subunit
MTGTSTLVLRGIEKRYGDTRALDGLDLSAHGGKILGVAGPNGAGKSTLVKVLGGEVDYDRGNLTFTSASGVVSSARPTAAVVHQETSLFANLTVAENICLARAEQGWRYPRAARREAELLAEMRLNRYANQPVSRCSLVVRQLTEIARALLVGDADVFLFDEPNSALTSEESELLFQRMIRLRDEGRVVLLVSHRLSDLVDYCDSVVVVRDGRVAETLQGEDLTEVRIAKELVVGVDVHAEHEAAGAPRNAARPGRDDRAAVQLRDWTHRGDQFRDISFVIPRGNVTALVGAEGSGARELLRSLAGLEGAAGTMAAQSGARVSPAETEYLPAERQVSLFSNLDVGQNIVARLGAPQIANRWGFLRRQGARELEQELANRFRVRSPGLRASIRALSGGNQQKVAIAAAVAKSPTLLALEEPTRGVDVGSTAEIYRLLRAYVDDGGAVVCYCTEIPEVFELADSVIVLSEGAIVGRHDVNVFDDIATLAHQIAADVVGARRNQPSPLTAHPSAD